MTAGIETPAGIGHNKGGPLEIIDETLRKADEIERAAKPYLELENADLMRRLAEINALIDRGLPAVLESQAESEKLSDVRYAIKKWVAAAKHARTAAKRPWDSIAKAFYAVFARPIDALEAIDAEKIEPVLSAWQDREAARQRQDAEEQARILRQEAERKAKEAAEAESRRLDAERREREAREAAERAERERQDAIERAVKARADAEAQERRAAEARRVAEAEARARVEESAKLEFEKLQRQLAEAREQAKAALRSRQDAERQAVAARKDARAEQHTETQAIDAAVRAEKHAGKKEARANASAADISRIRGEAGSVSSLRTYWTFRALDRHAIDLETLRPHIPIDALETAIRAFISAGGRTIAGAEIFEDQQTLTR